MNLITKRAIKSVQTETGIVYKQGKYILARQYMSVTILTKLAHLSK